MFLLQMSKLMHLTTASRAPAAQSSLVNGLYFQVFPLQRCNRRDWSHVVRTPNTANFAFI